MENPIKRLIMIGGSAGAYGTITNILEHLPKNFIVPIVIILHRSEKFTTKIESSLAEKLHLNVSTAKDKEIIQNNHVYFAPPGYHLLIEPNHSFCLDISEPVDFSRPSINVSFESASDIYHDNLTLFILSGANADGAKGMAYAASRGASCYIQSPNNAPLPAMPQSAYNHVSKAQIVNNLQLFEYFNHIPTPYEKY